MFICKGCSKDKSVFDWAHLSKGPCENCHFTDLCTDFKDTEIDPKWKENLRADLERIGRLDLMPE